MKVNIPVDIHNKEDNRFLKDEIKNIKNYVINELEFYDLKYIPIEFKSCRYDYSLGEFQVDEGCILSKDDLFTSDSIRIVIDKNIMSKLDIIDWREFQIFKDIDKFRSVVFHEIKHSMDFLDDMEGYYYIDDGLLECRANIFADIELEGYLSYRELEESL